MAAIDISPPRGSSAPPVSAGRSLRPAGRSGSGFFQTSSGPLGLRVCLPFTKKTCFLVLALLVFHTQALLACKPDVLGAGLFDEGSPGWGV